MFDLAQPPRAVEGVIPDGGPCRQGGCGKAGMVDASRDEVVCPRQIAFIFCTGEFSGGCVGAKLLVLPSVGLSVVRARCPVSEDLGAEGLKV